MSWWIDAGAGVVRQASPAVARAHGWLGPYPTRAAAQRALASSGVSATVPSRNSPPGNTGQGINLGPIHIPVFNPGSLVSGLFAGTAGILIRIAEIVAGLVLLAIGVNAMFKNKPLEIVTKTAGAVPKVVPV